ncbi:hypothetical protein C0991_006604, partial [Blastosporella zonata]
SPKEMLFVGFTDGGYRLMTMGTPEEEKNVYFIYMAFSGIIACDLIISGSLILALSKHQSIFRSAFAVDDTENQYLANLYGIVMGTSHQEPMMRSTPNEWDLYGNGTWDYTVNADNIKAYWLAGTQRAKPYESVYTVGQGAGIYYHIDYVGSPRDFKWITSSQISKIYEQMSLTVDREANRLWILNVGDLKPYERETTAVAWPKNMIYLALVFTISKLYVSMMYAQET